MRNIFILITCLYFFYACNSKDAATNELVSDSTQQVILFRNLLSLTHDLNEPIISDSTAFLLLPIQAICPSCRKKIIDSIMSNKNNLDDHHFIIISANGGKKTIEAYFKEQKHNWPDIKTNFFLDTSNLAFKIGLYKDKPVFFYGSDQRIFRKVSSVPATVKSDLCNFFNKKIIK